MYELYIPLSINCLLILQNNLEVNILERDIFSAFGPQNALLSHFVFLSASFFSPPITHAGFQNSEFSFYCTVPELFRETYNF
jgi:hypothetical protein